MCSRGILRYRWASVTVNVRQLGKTPREPSAAPAQRPLRSTPRGNRYFTVNGADTVTFSHSMSSFPLAPPAPDSVILRVSTGDDRLPMVSEARAQLAPSRMQALSASGCDKLPFSGLTATSSLLMPLDK
jgi:hypothetical protein